MRHRLAHAQKVLVVADGALWIWNLVEDRFEEAGQRLDLFHGKERLWAVAAALHGADTPQASQWVEPLLRQLKKGQAQKVIQTLEELAERLKRKNELKKIVKWERDYFKANQERMNYAAGQNLG